MKPVGLERLTEWPVTVWFCSQNTVQSYYEGQQSVEYLSILLFRADLLYITVIHSDTVLRHFWQNSTNYTLYTGICLERANVKLLFVILHCS